MPGSDQVGAQAFAINPHVGEQPEVFAPLYRPQLDYAAGAELGNTELFCGSGGLFLCLAFPPSSGVSMPFILMGMLSQIIADQT